MGQDGGGHAKCPHGTTFFLGLFWMYNALSIVYFPL